MKQSEIPMHNCTRYVWSLVSDHEHVPVLIQEKERLDTLTKELLSEKELNGMIVQEKIVESKQQKKHVDEVGVQEGSGE